MTNQSGKTDAQLAELDVDMMLRAGLGGTEAGADADRTALFGDGAVAGAILLDRVDVIPRSVGFLAEIVRRGGASYAAGLPEPLPTAEQTAVIRPWLAAATETATTADRDESVARWLEAVAAVLALRAGAR
ncbi:MAG: hypothetical protein GEV28_16750 [Actinophytocola sp.]|uniref:hypothetical protein n=1 Tax=Actinophytocola sp. TaxID=1872138 RepID=UPI0013281CDF|nr:hypothetical protein [Actinophytocola sp.]MPZ81945.1 hypothetical protein [Actinophytocola sp.]